MMLFNQIAVAVLLLVFTLCLQCVGVAVLIESKRRVITQDTQGFGPIRSAVLVMESTIAIIILHGLVILLWASFYRFECFPSWERAFYFSASSYATVGYGDVTLPTKWILLGPLESMAGVLMCGVSVCILFAMVTRLVDGNARDSKKQSGSTGLGLLSQEGSHLSEQHYACSNVETSDPLRDPEVKLKAFNDDVPAIKEAGRIAVSHKAPSSLHKDSSTPWNTWISISAISVLIVVLVMLELHVRRLSDHSTLPR